MSAAGAQVPVAVALRNHGLEFAALYAVGTTDVFRFTKSRPFDQAGSGPDWDLGSAADDTRGSKREASAKMRQALRS